MRLRTALIAVTAVALAAPAAPAVAAKKKPVPKVCNLLVDDKGDGDWRMGGGVVSSDSLDIVSADISTGAKEFVAVLRLAKAPSTSDTWSNLSYRWRMGASGNGVRYDFDMRRGFMNNPQNTSVSVGGQQVAHKFAIVGDTLVWRFDRKLAPAMAKPKLVWGDMAANTNVLDSTADSAASEKKYPDRTPSCVTAA
jgi:hypothetical protein